MSSKAKKVLRTLAKVFLIIGSVLRIVFIVPIILAFKAYTYIDEEGEDKSTKKLIWSIVTFFLCGNIAGILMLIDAIIVKITYKKIHEASKNVD